MGLISEIGSGPVALDTSIFIYFLEENPTYLSAVQPVFEAIDGGRLEAVTSTLTLLEVLVHPYRTQNLAVAALYEAQLRQSRGLTLIELGQDLLRLAAEIRAVTGLRTPDSIQMAAGLLGECPVFLCNDRRLPRRIRGMRILPLQPFVGP